MENTAQTKKKPSAGVSLTVLLIVIAVIILVIRLGVAGPMAVFIGAAVAMFLALALKTKWDDLFEAFTKNIKNCSIPFMVMFMVGVMIGAWMIGGTLPSMIYYGTKIISPSALIPVAFILCGLTSIFTGTSLGSIGTMGLAMYGIGLNMGIDVAPLVGAIVSGAFLGDKMSPLSDTTNVAPAMSGTDLYSHIGSMMYTTIPAAVISLILYIILGIRAGEGAADMSTIELVQETLQTSFNISPICLLPLVLVLALAILKVPAILAMVSSVIFSVVLGMITQGVPLKAMMGTCLGGYSSQTGVGIVDTILSRGGATSMGAVIALVVFANLMAASLQASGVLDSLVESFFVKFIKGRRSLIISTLIYSYLIVGATSNQMLGIIVPGQTMGPNFDAHNIDRKVLSRSLEDSATIGAAIIPWSTACAHVFGVLGCTAAFIPFAFLCYLVPVFSVICAFTGFGIWTSEGKPVWKKQK